MNRVIKFGASWCHSCKMLARMLDDMGTTTPIEVVDIDAHPEIAQEFGVRGVPTLIAFNGNTEVYRAVGMQTQDKLNQFFEGTYAKG